MPRMLVTTETLDRTGGEVLMNEYVATTDLASVHFATQLVERIGWALADAESVERDTLVMASADAARGHPAEQLHGGGVGA
jgi:hypothetical protein